MPKVVQFPGAAYISDEIVKLLDVAEDGFFEVSVTEKKDGTMSIGFQPMGNLEPICSESIVAAAKIIEMFDDPRQRASIIQYCRNICTFDRES